MTAVFTVSSSLRGESKLIFPVVVEQNLKVVNWEESVLGTSRGSNMASADTISGVANRLEIFSLRRATNGVPLSPGMCGSCLH